MRLFLAALTAAILATASAQIGTASGTVLERQPYRVGSETFYYTVYLPAGYDRDTRSYGVVYLLHGYGGADTDWVRYGDAAFVADRLIADNLIPPTILVMPDGRNSWYGDSPYGDYETGFLGLVAHVDATYRTVPERASRAVGGLSMGGYGAARLAVKYPERFAAAAVMSGAVFPEVSEELTGLFGEVFGTPLDAARYRRELPETLLERWTEGTEKPAFYVTVGDGDTLTPYPLSARLHGALREAGARTQFRVTNGPHAWPVWKSALDDALIFFTREFERYY